LNANIGICKIETGLRVVPEKIFQLMQIMLKSAELYNLSRGIHTSPLCNDEGVIVLGEDIGRHNTLDKIMGECLLRKISTKDKILLTSGRVSSEMI
jgi:FdhD protein